jgi:hypothetical protein
MIPWQKTLDSELQDILRDRTCRRIAHWMKFFSHMNSLEVDVNNSDFVQGVGRMIAAGWRPTEQDLKVLCWPNADIEGVDPEEQGDIFQNLKRFDGFNEVDAFLEDYYC